MVPSDVASGDTVNVFAQDFPAGTGGFVELKIAGQVISGVSASSIRMDGSGEATFEVPGGFEGVLRIDAKWGDVNENSKITITGGDLSVSKTDVAAQRDHHHHRQWFRFADLHPEEQHHAGQRAGHGGRGI